MNITNNVPKTGIAPPTPQSKSGGTQRRPYAARLDHIETTPDNPGSVGSDGDEMRRMCLTFPEGSRVMPQRQMAFRAPEQLRCAWSACGRYLARAGSELSVEGLPRGMVRVPLEDGWCVKQLLWHPRLPTLLCMLTCRASGARQLRALDVHASNTGDVPRTAGLPLPEDVSSVAVSADGHSLAALGARGIYFIDRFLSRSPRVHHERFEARVTGAQWSAQQSLLLVTLDSGEAHIFWQRPDRVQRVDTLEPGYYRAVSWSATADSLAYIKDENCIVVRTFENGVAQAVRTREMEGVYALCWSPATSTRLVSCLLASDLDGMSQVLDPMTLQVQAHLSAFAKRRAVNWGPDGDHISIEGGHRRILWRVSTGDVTDVSSEPLTFAYEQTTVRILDSQLDIYDGGTPVGHVLLNSVAEDLHWAPGGRALALQLEDKILKVDLC